MDKIDKKILSELQKDADRRIFQIEKATQIPRSTIHNRIKKLKKEVKKLEKAKKKAGKKPAKKKKKARRKKKKRR